MKPLSFGHSDPVPVPISVIRLSENFQSTACLSCTTCLSGISMKVDGHIIMKCNSLSLARSCATEYSGAEMIN